MENTSANKMNLQEFKDWIQREVNERKENGMLYSALLFTEVLNNIPEVKECTCP